MKKLIIFLGLFLPVMIVSGQNLIEALRYSQTTYGGTARSTAMGGAFGALGADISAISYNPGGIAVYRSNELTFTPTLYFNDSEANFIPDGNLDSDNIYSFNLNNFGVAAAYKSAQETGWVNVNFAVGYNKLQNFNRNISISGINNNSSMAYYWADDAWGRHPDDLDAFGSGLAFDTWLLDTIPGTLYEYGTAFPSLGQEQVKNISSEGSMGEYVFAFGGNYSHQLYLGMAFGIGVLRYEENSTYKETDVNGTIYDFNQFIYQQHLKQNGTGFNLKIGAIYRPMDFLRIGLAVHTPTLWNIDEEYYTSLDAFYDNPDSDGYSSYSASSPQNDYSYEITTPFRALASMGVMIKKTAMVSIDYEFVDYSKARLRSDDYDFDIENDEIREEYTAAHNIKIGGEYKVGPFALRAGYGFYGSPFSSKSIREDAVRHSLSAGAGMHTGAFFLDFAFVHTISTETQILYEPLGANPVPGADVDSNTNRMLLTFGFRF